jgi:hypothetical protein
MNVTCGKFVLFIFRKKRTKIHFKDLILSNLSNLLYFFEKKIDFYILIYIAKYRLRYKNHNADK